MQTPTGFGKPPNFRSVRRSWQTLSKSWKVSLRSRPSLQGLIPAPWLQVPKETVCRELAHWLQMYTSEPDAESGRPCTQQAPHRSRMAWRRFTWEWPAPRTDRLGGEEAGSTSKYCRKELRFLAPSYCENGEQLPAESWPGVVASPEAGPCPSGTANQTGSALSCGVFQCLSFFRRKMWLLCGVFQCLALFDKKRKGMYLSLSQIMKDVERPCTKLTSFDSMLKDIERPRRKRAGARDMPLRGKKGDVQSRASQV
jgi:hypothetical protein